MFLTELCSTRNGFVMFPLQFKTLSYLAGKLADKLCNLHQVTSLLLTWVFSTVTWGYWIYDSKMLSSRNIFYDIKVLFLFVCLFLFFKFYFIFKLYITVLVLPNIKMNPPQVYMCFPSWTLLPPHFQFHPSGSSFQYTLAYKLH